MGKRSTNDLLYKSLASGKDSYAMKFISSGINCNKTYFKDDKNNSVLHVAVQFGNTDIVRYLIEKGKVDVNKGNTLDETPLHIAVLHEQFDLVELLVKCGANVNALDKIGNTALYYALGRHRRRNIAEYLISSNADVNILNAKRQNVLHRAVILNRLDLFKQLVDRGADFKALDVNNYSPLRYAASFSRLEMLRYMIDEKLVNEKEAEPHLLHYVVGWRRFDAEGGVNVHVSDSANKYLDRQIKMVKYLIDARKNDVNKLNANEETPLHLAASFCDRTIIELLLNRGANCSIVDLEGNSVLHRVVMSYNENLNIVKHLINVVKMDVNACNKLGRTPFHLAAAQGHLDTVKFLFGKGADSDVVDFAGDSALHVAVSRGHTKVARYLTTTVKIDLNKRNFKGVTALHLACAFDELIIFKLLVNSGADCHVIDNYGDTCLHYAARTGSVKIAKILVTEKNLSIRECNKKGYSALQLALLSYHSSTARMFEGLSEVL